MSKVVLVTNSDKYLDIMSYVNLNGHWACIYTSDIHSLALFPNIQLEED